MKWYLRGLMKYDELRGRASRTEFWKFAFYNLIFILTAIAVDNIFDTTAAGLPYGLFNFFYILAIIIPCISVVIRRLHDVGRSGWFSLVILIPLIGIIWLVILLCEEGVKETNKYGTNPDLIAFN